MPKKDVDLDYEEFVYDKNAIIKDGKEEDQHDSVEEITLAHDDDKDFEDAKEKEGATDIKLKDWLDLID